MATFVSRKLKAFDTDRTLEARRSEARLKTYPSSIDVRAWCDVVEERRQHILELMVKDRSKCLGKIVPIEDLILISCKTSLRMFCEEVVELYKFIDQLNITSEQRRKVESIRSKSLCRGILKENKDGVLGKPQDIFGGIKEEGAGQQSLAVPVKGGEESEAESSPAASSAMESAQEEQVDSVKEEIKPDKKNGWVDVQNVMDSAGSPTNAEQSTQRHSQRSQEPHEEEQGNPSGQRHSQRSGKSNEGEKPSLGTDQGLSAIASVDSASGIHHKASPNQSSTSNKSSDTRITSPSSIKCGCEDEDDEKSDFCEEGIKSLEDQINNIKSDDTNCVALLDKELKMLKKYCKKINTLQQENDELKATCNGPQNNYNFGVSPNLNINTQVTHDSSILDKIANISAEFVSCKRPDHTCAALDDLLKERDMLLRKLEQMQEVEEELFQLRSKAARVDELEQQLLDYQRSGKNNEFEAKRNRSKCDQLEKEVQNLKCEKECMNKRINCMKQENDCLKCRCKEMELIKLERDHLQIKVNELSQIQADYEEILPQLSVLENVKNERDNYKRKYEEVISLARECECIKNQVEQAKQILHERDELVNKVDELECCVCDQEEEIKCLVDQIDQMNRNGDHTQERVKGALSTMRRELERKDQLIAQSEEKLASVQAQLRNSIKGVTCEAGFLKAQNEKLSMELKQANASLADKIAQIKYLQQTLREQNICICKMDKDKKYSNLIGKSDGETIDIMRKELENAKAENRKLQDIASKMMTLAGDEHVEMMLKQSECAVKRVVEELGRQYNEWERVKGADNLPAKLPKRHRPPHPLCCSERCEKFKCKRKCCKDVPVQDLSIISETAEKLKDDPE